MNEDVDFQMDLGLDVTQHGPCSVIAVFGEVDVASVPRLREQLHSLVAEGRNRIVVDLDGVGFLDSTGLGVLVGALKRTRAHGGSLGLVCNQPQIRKVFEVTRLTRVFDLYPTVGEAVEGAPRDE